ncbi:MAG: TetR/AcrR family transcriptional regulator [Pseudomonadota bacterium]
MKKPAVPHVARTPRRPGRPTRSDAGQRARLLDTALQLFARQGIAATSVNRIAREAGVTPALMNYYFGNREQLLDVLVSERLLPLIGNLVMRLQAGGEGPGQTVPVFVRTVMETLDANPWLPPLWVREVLSDGGLLRERLLGNARLLAPIMRDRFAAAQQGGRLNPDVDPRLLMVSLIGLTIFPFAARPIWRSLFAADDIDTEVMIKHTLALLTRGLEVKS